MLPQLKTKSYFIPEFDYTPTGQNPRSSKHELSQQDRRLLKKLINHKNSALGPESSRVTMTSSAFNEIHDMKMSRKPLAAA
jgi:hypothetical protein